jgi:hypothetical protein
VRKYIESRSGAPAGTTDPPANRWEEFTKLLSMPMVPSGLLKSPAASLFKTNF